jgi:hypothetical protein
MSIFSSDQDASALWTDLFVVRAVLFDCEDFSGTAGDPPVVLDDGVGAIQNKSADREMMSVMFFSRSRLQAPRLNLGVAVGLELCLETPCADLPSS